MLKKEKIMCSASSFLELIAEHLDLVVHSLPHVLSCFAHILFGLGDGLGSICHAFLSLFFGFFISILKIEFELDLSTLPLTELLEM